MCNLLRYKDQMQAAYGVFDEIKHTPLKPKIRFKVAPSEPAPVITLAEGKARLGLMEFGLRTQRGRQMMARGETVAELRMFREGFRRQRCLIMAHGFYDSLDMGAHRQPWHIHLKGDELMGFAGIWETNPQGDAFAIISAPANAVVARVIDRMPVILPKEVWRAWLSPEAKVPDLQSMLSPFPADQMEAWPVTRKVNQRGYDAPDCVEPIIPEQDELALF